MRNFKCDGDFNFGWMSVSSVVSAATVVGRCVHVYAVGTRLDVHWLAGVYQGLRLVCSLYLVHLGRVNWLRVVDGLAVNGLPVVRRVRAMVTPVTVVTAVTVTLHLISLQTLLLIVQ